MHGTSDMLDQAPGTPTDYQLEPERDAPESPGSGTDRSSGLESLLQELRVLLQGVQVLTGFLIVLPFYQGFAKIERTEQQLYLVTFACSLSSLILFSAPAAQHRLGWPLYDRARFHALATRVIIIGLVPFSLALILGTQLVVSQVFGGLPSILAAVAVGALIAAAWWLFPLLTKNDRA
ncbi:MAG TPA: DUF6328 family protein [Ktedonobacterales bacterium]